MRDAERQLRSRVLKLESAVSVIHHSPHDRLAASAQNPAGAASSRVAQAPPSPLGITPDLEAYRKLVLKLHYSEKKLHRAQAELRGGGTPGSASLEDPPGGLCLQDSPSFEDDLDQGFPRSKNSSGREGSRPISPPLARSLGDELHAAHARKASSPVGGVSPVGGRVAGGWAGLAPGEGQGLPPTGAPSPGVTAQHWKHKYFQAHYESEKLRGRIDRMTEELMVLSMQVERLQSKQSGGTMPPPGQAEQLEVDLRPSRDIVCAKVGLLLRTARSSLDQLAASQEARGEATESHGHLHALFADVDGVRTSLESLTGAKGRPALSPKSPLWRAAFAPPSSKKEGGGQQVPRRISGGNPFAEQPAEGPAIAGPAGAEGSGGATRSPSRLPPPSQGGLAPETPADRPESPRAFKFPVDAASGEMPPGLVPDGDGSGGSPVRTPQQLLEAFKAADADGDGCLDSAELQGVLRKLGLEADGAGWGRRSGAPLVFSECKKIVLELSQARNA